jgi:ABC-type multidrug transport system fused ATPase/permease subunit
MLKAVGASLTFMDLKERVYWWFLLGLKAILSFFDLFGILAIGFVVTSTAIFLTSGSDPDRVIKFAGLEIPAVNAQTLPWVSAAIVLLFVTKALFSIILTKKAAYFVARVEARSARAIAQISLGGDLLDARKRSREELVFAIQVGSPSAFNSLLNAVNAFATEALLFLLICIGFLLVNPWATLAAIIYFGLIAFAIQFFVGSRMTRAGVISTEGSITANAAISDLYSIFREALVLGKTDEYIDKIYAARLSAADSAATHTYLGGMPRHIIETSLLVGIGLFVVSQALAGDIVESAATVGVFLSGGFRLTAALLPLQSALLAINGVIPAATKAHEILKLQAVKPQEWSNLNTTECEISSNQDPAELASPFGVKFESVCFKYPDTEKPALDNLTFEIKAGTQVAIMGPSGAGKSTVADLICMVLKPSSGHIYRTDIAGIQNQTKQFSNVSYVPQRPGLVSGSILENVAIAEVAYKVDRGRVMEALRLAHLAELINELPDGIDTVLGKLQDGLSGGQLQRLGLARALYARPGLLVMDEATSALDAVSEAEIQLALDEMRGKVTVVLIAHRLNTIQKADKVILIENGRIMDSGTFSQLVSNNPSVENVVRLMRVKTD